MRKFGLVVLAVLAVGVSGCGKKLDSASYGDVAKITGMMQSETGSSLTIQDALSVAQGQANLASFGDQLTDYCAQIGQYTSSLPKECTSSCSGNVWSVTCTVAGTETYACGADSYTMSNRSATIGVDFGKIEQMSSNATINDAITISFSGNVTGGTLKGGELKAKLHIASLTAKKTDSITCSDFDMTYDGKSVSCDDLNKTRAGLASTDSCAKK